MQSAQNGLELTVFDEPIAVAFSNGVDPISKCFDPPPPFRRLGGAQQAAPPDTDNCTDVTGERAGRITGVIGPAKAPKWQIPASWRNRTEERYAAAPSLE